MSDWLFTCQYARDRQDEILREFETKRLLKTARAEKAAKLGKKERAMCNLGRALVSLGLKLQQRYGSPSMELDSNLALVNGKPLSR